MVEIQITAYQCDFCSVKGFEMPACILCGKHICEKHRGAAGVKVSLTRESNNRLYYSFSREEYICFDCANDKPNLLRKIAIVLSNEADRIESEPPQEPEL